MCRHEIIKSDALSSVYDIEHKQKAVCCCRRIRSGASKIIILSFNELQPDVLLKNRTGNGVPSLRTISEYRKISCVDCRYLDLHAYNIIFKNYSIEI